MDQGELQAQDEEALVFWVVAAQNHASPHCLPTGSYGDLQEQPGQGQGQGHQGGRVSGRVSRSRRRAAALEVRLSPRARPPA